MKNSFKSNLSEKSRVFRRLYDFLKEIGQISKTEPIIEQYLELVPDDENMRNLLTDLNYFEIDLLSVLFFSDISVSVTFNFHVTDWNVSQIF